MNRAQLQELTKLRVEEAKILYENNCFNGAYYLLGYAVECALKACIAKQVQQYDFPDKQLANDSYTHNLIKLLKTANLDKELNKDEYKDFKVSWLIITYTNTYGVVWSEAIRYYTDYIDFTQATEFFDAVTDKDKGILKWLEKYW
ncbi:MAG: DNA-binding protein [Gammaproteobacteria bacterium]|nr:MAG: DNA-binding protein [Gammaproteobacteria bacterium]